VIVTQPLVIVELFISTSIGFPIVQRTFSPESIRLLLRGLALLVN
jgi:hypothetical protein